jgi:hypothetical protein
VTAEDDFASILVKLKPVPSSRKSTPKNVTTPRPEFLEPLSPTPLSPVPSPTTTPWELVGMTEADYTAMQARVQKQMRESMREDYINNLLADLKNPSFWYRRMDSLETEREYFNKKRGWSAVDIACVKKIDEEIKECEEELDALCEQQDRLEYEYD